MIHRRDFVLSVIADVRSRLGECDIQQPENTADNGVVVPFRVNGETWRVTASGSDLETSSDVGDLAKRCVDMAVA